MSEHITAARPTTLTELVAAASQAGSTAQAQGLYQRWIGENPDHPQLYIAHFNHACLLTDLGNNAAAISALGAVLALNPDFLPARINLGGMHERTGAPNVALEHWQGVTQRLVAVTGAAIIHKATALRQMARLLMDHQRHCAAEAVLRQSLDIMPTQRDVIEQYMAVRLAQCSWPVAQGWEGMPERELLRGMSPLSLLAYTDDPLMQLGLAHHAARALVDETQDLSPHDRRHAAIPSDRRLRIGYISSDLRDHAIGYLMAELWEQHDPTRVEVFVYYCGPASESPIQARARAAIEHWADIRGLSDDAAAALIAADGIDILVDVNGFTRDARTAVFARRPAPVQINWLGYPGTMGTPYHHYIIADPWIIPPGAELYYSEEVLRLPCYQANDRKRVISPAPNRLDAGLPEDAFVFCCFNASQKFTRPTMDRWLEILTRVPGSVLWLLDSGEDMRRNLLQYLASQGVGAERLVFAPKLANADHLARYRLADLFLDTAPYGAHTTASDALWLGVPVLTLSGRSFASRVCGSLVRSAGTPELVCSDAREYVEHAVALAQNPAELRRHRETLARRRTDCDLFNMEQLADRLEALYAEVAQRHRAGTTPEPRLQNLDTYLETGLRFAHEKTEMLTLPDYTERYRAALLRRHHIRPLAEDPRLMATAPKPRKPRRK